MRIWILIVGITSVGLLCACEESREGTGAGEAGGEASGGGGETSSVVSEVAEPGVTGEEAGDASVSGDDLQRDLSRALGTAGQYAAQKKESLVVAAGEKLAAMEDDIERLKEKGHALGGEAKSRWERMRTQLEVKAAAAKEELAKAKSAGAAAWDDASVGLGRAMEEVGKAYEAAVENFEETPGAPDPGEASPIQP